MNRFRRTRARFRNIRRIGVLADSHTQIERARLAAAIMRDAGVEMLVYSGDLACRAETGNWAGESGPVGAGWFARSFPTRAAECGFRRLRRKGSAKSRHSDVGILFGRILLCAPLTSVGSSMAAQEYVQNPFQRFQQQVHQICLPA